MDSLATLSCPAIGYGIRYDFGMFEQRIDGGRQVEQHDNWLQLGNAWELPRHEDAQTVRFGGPRRVPARPRRPPARRLGRDARGDRLPYDSFIVGHRTDTRTRCGCGRRARRATSICSSSTRATTARRSRRRSTPRTSPKVLYPNDQSDEGKALRSSSSTSSSPCSIATSVRPVQDSCTADFAACPKKVRRIQLNDIQPVDRRSPS
jgi:starch phosphorylase